MEPRPPAVAASFPRLAPGGDSPESLNPKGEGPVSPIEVVSAEAASAAVREAQRLFHRTLAGWARDVLVLNRRGAIVPLWSEAPDDDLQDAIAA